MQPYVCDMSDFSFLRKLFYLGASISFAEILTYPFDRVKTILFSKSTLPTRSLFGYREFHYVSLEIMNVEGFFGLFYGLKVGFDRTFSFMLPKFFIFYYMFRQKNKNPSWFGLLNISIVSHTFAALIAQISNVLKIKLQCDPIVASNLKKLDSISMKYRAMSEIYSKDHLFLFRCGLGTSILAANTIGLIELIGFITSKSFFDRTCSWTDKDKITFAVLLSSFVTTILVNPIETLHTKVVLEEFKENPLNNRKNLAMEIIRKSNNNFFFQGLLPNLIRNCCFNTILVYILLKGIKFEEKKRIFREYKYEDYENYLEKQFKK